MGIHEKLANIQQELKAPKNQFNSFGDYKYRSQEDILEALKPLLKKEKVLLTIEDEVIIISEAKRVYVKATVVLTDIEDQTFIPSRAYAREPEHVKGQDEAQITGATSSYARKYALNGMFLIDDAKDPDATETHGKEGRTPDEQKKAYQDSLAPEDPKLGY